MTGHGVVGQAAAGGRHRLDPDRFRQALAYFPSGVTIVTALDTTGTPHGFTASAFCSVSLDPPLVCACLARSARCHPVFAACDEFAVSVLRPEHTELALRFARKGEDKFAHGRFRRTTRRAVVVADALAAVECVVHDRYEVGDHTMLIGEVQQVHLSTGEPLVFFNRTFHHLAEPTC